MKINDLFKNNNGEVVRVVEVDETRKTVMIEFADGKTKQLSFSTLKDKRRWTPVDVSEEVDKDEQNYVDEIMQQKKDLGIECPEIESYEVVDETEICSKDEKKAAKKSSKKNLIEYNGKALTLHGWAKELGVPFGTLYARITRFNWTYEEALSGKKNK